MDFVIIDRNEDNSLKCTNFSSNQNEEKDKLGENLTQKQFLSVSKQAEKSVCEIIKDKGYGFGFFCKIKLDTNEICCLFSNNHIISEEMLSNDESIKIKLNNKIYNISLNLKRRIWKDKNIDFTCIEIIEEDNLISKIMPFEIDENNYNIEYQLQKYDKRCIITLSIGNKGYIEITKGIIDYIQNNNDIFLHNCCTEIGFSGGPIILVNNSKIMGINCGSKNNKNIGVYLKEIIENIETFENLEKEL